MAAVEKTVDELPGFSGSNIEANQHIKMLALLAPFTKNKAVIQHN
jgi:hypothetical protein